MPQTRSSISSSVSFRLGLTTFCVFAGVALPLAGQVDWRPLTPANTPTGRAGHGMAYDTVNDRIVLHGGYDGTQRLADTWVYDGNDWTQVQPLNSPGIRVAHPMVYDSIRNRVVLFGGLDASGVTSDTWEWDGQDWSLMSPAISPPARRSHCMVFHPIRGTTVMWGGIDANADVNDTWEWDGVNWRQINTQNAPPARRASDMAWDPVGGGVLLFSGYQQGPDTWYFDGVDWRQLQPVTTPPQRYDHTMATDLLRRRIVMFGGTGTADTWEWDGADWVQRMPVSLPPARYDDYMVWDSLRERVVMFGGLTGNPDLWEFSTDHPARWAAFGGGCVGSNGRAPLHDVGGLPWAGEPFEVAFTNLRIPATTTVAFIGFSNTNWGGFQLPFALDAFGLTGCSLRVEPFVNQGIPSNNGRAAFTLTMPTDPAALGLGFYTQALALDPGANPGNATTSDGGTAVIGIR